MTPAENEAWKIWVNYCCMVKAWYTKDQPEPFGMNPPTEQIADASIAADAELTRLREAVEWALGFSANEDGTVTYHITNYDDRKELRRRADAAKGGKG